MDSFYDEARNPDHKTYADGVERQRRDKDAFDAGAQHALDKMLNTLDHYPMPPVLKMALDREAAGILRSIHGGL